MFPVFLLLLQLCLLFLGPLDLFLVLLLLVAISSCTKYYSHGIEMLWLILLVVASLLGVLRLERSGEVHRDGGPEEMVHSFEVSKHRHRLQEDLVEVVLGALVDLNFPDTHDLLKVHLFVEVYDIYTSEILQHLLLKVVLIALDDWADQVLEEETNGKDLDTLLPGFVEHKDLVKQLQSILSLGRLQQNRNQFEELREEVAQPLLTVKHPFLLLRVLLISLG